MDVVRIQIRCPAVVDGGGGDAQCVEAEERRLDRQREAGPGDAERQTCCCVLAELRER